MDDGSNQNQFPFGHLVESEQNTPTPLLREGIPSEISHPYTTDRQFPPPESKKWKGGKTDGEIKSEEMEIEKDNNLSE